MRPETRFKFNESMTQLAKLNGVSKVSEKFNVAPTIQQKLEDKIQLSSAFLQKINIFLVQEQSGSAVGLGISRPIASRTNTDTTDRQAKDPTSMDERFYMCRKTDFDTAIKYQKLDQWAKFKDFYARFSGQIQKRQGLQICCPEEIAFDKGWINSEQLSNLAQKYMKTDYGKYLKDVADNVFGEE